MLKQFMQGGPKLQLLARYKLIHMFQLFNPLFRPICLLF